MVNIWNIYFILYLIEWIVSDNILFFSHLDITPYKLQANWLYWIFSFLQCFKWWFRVNSHPSKFFFIVRSFAPFMLNVPTIAYYHIPHVLDTFFMIDNMTLSCICYFLVAPQYYIFSILQCIIVLQTTMFIHTTHNTIGVISINDENFSSFIYSCIGI